jgi:hypothetical protein
MSNQSTTSTSRSSGRGCLFYGCLTLVVIFLLTVVGGYFGVRYAVKSFVNRFTDTQPLTLPQVEISKMELDALDQRVAEFRKGVDAQKPGTVLELTVKELNALIDRNAELKGKLYVTIESDQVKGQISIPLGDIPIPLIQGWLKGRYLNGSAGLKGSLENGVLIVTLQSVEVNGKPIPSEVLSEIRKQNLAKDLYQNPKNAELIRKFESLEIKDGKIIVRGRTQNVILENEPVR